jgi:hypothetical protein
MQGFTIKRQKRPQKKYVLFFGFDAHIITDFSLFFSSSPRNAVHSLSSIYVEASHTIKFELSSGNKNL